MKTCNTIKSKPDQMRKYLNDYIIMKRKMWKRNSTHYNLIHYQLKWKTKFKREENNITYLIQDRIIV